MTSDTTPPVESIIDTSKLKVAIIKYVATPILTGLLLSAALFVTEGRTKEPEANLEQDINSIPNAISNCPGNTVSKAETYKLN
jgi:hypothetical protein